MTAESLRNDLAARGIWLGIAGANLRVSAPKGTMTPELQQVIVDHKAELLVGLKTGWAESAKRMIADCPDPEGRAHLTEFYDSAVGVAKKIGGLDQDDVDRDAFGRLMTHLLQCQIDARDDARPVVDRTDPPSHPGSNGAAERGRTASKAVTGSRQREGVGDD